MKFILKTLCLLIFCIFYLSANSQTVQEIDTITQQTIDIESIDDSVQNTQEQTFQEYYQDGVYSYNNVAIKPSFQGASASEFNEWISWNVEYTDEMRKNKIQGTIIASFIISPYGTISDSRIERGLIAELDNQVLNAIHNSPRWSPGRDKQRNPVSVKLYSVTEIRLRTDQGYEPASTSQLIDDFADYETITVKPKFNDGNVDIFVGWLKDNVVYPKRSIKRGVFGELKVEFIIDIHGNIRNLKLVEGVEDNTDKAFLRALLKSPRWTPGRNAFGRVVPTKIQLSFFIDAIIRNKSEEKEVKREEKEKAKEEKQEAKEQAKYEKELAKDKAAQEKEELKEKQELEKQKREEEKELQKLKKELGD